MQTSSLVKYNTPILVSVSNAKKNKTAGNKTTTQTEDILNSILPPRLFIIICSIIYNRHFSYTCIIIIIILFIIYLVFIVNKFYYY